MNKEKLKKQNNLLIYLGIFVAVALILASILRILTPKEEQIIESNFVSKNYNYSETEFKKVTFTGKSIDVPKTFKVLRPISNINQADLIAEQIIINYQLLQHESRENYWLNENINLIKRRSENEYVFYNYGLTEASSSSQLNKDLAIKNCKSFLEEYEVDIDIQVPEDKIQYFDEGLEPEETTLEDAAVAYIPMYLEIDQYQIFYQNENNFPFYCKTNKNSQITTFSFKDPLSKFEEVKKLNSISLDRAVNNISRGKASIIRAKSEITDIFDLTYIQRADLESVEIDYRYDNELKILYPFYKFRANIIDIDGIKIKAEIITPAVNSAQEQ